MLPYFGTAETSNQRGLPVHCISFHVVPFVSVDRRKKLGPGCYKFCKCFKGPAPVFDKESVNYRLMNGGTEPS